MQIGTRHIGPGQPPYVIAEIGVNHDGSVERAIELVDAARTAGADAVKLQLFKTDLLMSRSAKLAAYQKAAGETDPISMLRRLELSIEQMIPIVDRAHADGLHAIVTVFSVELVAPAERLAWDAYKSASPDIIHRPLLEALLGTGKPLIMSTGASNMEEVVRAVEWVSAARTRLAVLQCVSSYPTPSEHAALGGIAALRNGLELPVGYSDHTKSVETARSAVSAGACILEKHLTYSKLATGPDHSSSLEPAEFAAYVRLAREAGVSAGASQEDLGERTKLVLAIEQDVRTVSRQSVVVARALPAGHQLTRADLTFKRPGTGIRPFRIAEIIGRSLARAIDADTTLTDSHLAPRQAST